jgi:hypothetical protein
MIVLRLDFLEECQVETLGMLAVVVVLFDEGLLGNEGGLHLEMFAIKHGGCLLLGLFLLQDF